MLVLILSLLVTVKVQRAFPGGSSVKNPPAVQETRVRPLGWEDPLEKEMATHPQYSCLGNSMDRGAWQATVQGVTKSQTRLTD